METKRELALLSKYLDSKINVCELGRTSLYQLGNMFYSDLLLNTTYTNLLIEENLSLFGGERIKTNYTLKDIKERGVELSLDNIQTININDLECKIDGFDLTVNLTDLQTSIKEMSESEFKLIVLDKLLFFVDKSYDVYKIIILKELQRPLF